MTTIGSARTCDIVVAGQGVSPLHAAISMESGRYVLRNRNSQNGVWSYGRRVFAERLNAGGQFKIGASIYALIAPDDALPLAEDHTTFREQPRSAPAAPTGSPYERLERIGAGGQVTVYRARQSRQHHRRAEIPEQPA